MTQGEKHVPWRYPITDGEVGLCLLSALLLVGIVKAAGWVLPYWR